MKLKAADTFQLRLREAERGGSVPGSCIYCYCVHILFINRHYSLETVVYIFRSESPFLLS